MCGCEARDPWAQDEIAKIWDRIDELELANARLRDRVDTLEQVALVLSAGLCESAVLPQTRGDVLMEVGNSNKYPYWPKVNVIYSVNERKWMLGLDYSGEKP